MIRERTPTLTTRVTWVAGLIAALWATNAAAGSHQLSARTLRHPSTTLGARHTDAPDPANEELRARPFAANPWSVAELWGSSNAQGTREPPPVAHQNMTRSFASRRHQTSYAAPPIASTAPSSSAGRDTPIAFEKYRLDNGLEIILHHDSTIPLVAVNIWYHVGPVNEPPGRSGFAHLFEHLMFEGSKHVGPNFDRLLESAGATNANGTTSWDRTNYYETVPREYLELILWIESDRMGFLRDSITQQRLDIQREVVKNERRQSYENAPYGPSTLALLDTLFPDGHPYHGAVIGSMRDLEAASLSDVWAFADAYYAPSNATLTVAGDFDPSLTRGWLQKYFGTLRTVPPPSPIRNQKGEPSKTVRLVVPEPVEIPKIVFAWLAPPAYSPEHAQLSVLARVLADGKSSRLYRSLVVEQRIALDIDADVDANALATIFTVEAQVAGGVAIDRVERRLGQELDRLVQAPPSTAELQRARKLIQMGIENDLELLNGRSGESGRAGLLQRFNHYLGDPGALTRWRNAVNAVTSADVAQLAAKALGREHRVTVVTEPTGSRP